MALTHQWKFNGDALDSVGTANGTVTGSVSYVDGVDGKACKFPGDKASRITCTSAADLQPVNMTIACWVRITDQRYTGSIISKWWDGSNRSWSLDFNTSGAYYGFSFDAATNGNNSDHLGAYNLMNPDFRRWYHVVGTFDVAGRVKCYVDGILGNITTTIGGSVRSNTADVAFGCQPRNPTPTSVFDPATAITLDDVRMYNTALTQAEVTTLYQSYSRPNVVNRPPSVGYGF